MRSGLEGTNLAANSAGFLSFFLLWLAVVWGIVLRNGWASTRIRHATVYGIHQTVALLGLCLGVVHACVVELNRGEQIKWANVFIPFANQIGPLNHRTDRFYPDVNAVEVNHLGVSVGVVGLELLVAAAASVLIQRRIGYSRWRGVHSLTYAAFALVVAHILISGADQGPPLIWGSVAGCWLVSVAVWLGTPVWAAISESRFGHALPLTRRGPAMTVHVNAAKCERSGFCVQMAPTVFRLRSENRLTYRSSVYPTEIEAVTRAAEACPVRAIALGLAPTTVVTSLPQPIDTYVRSARSRATSGPPRRQRDS